MAYVIQQPHSVSNPEDTYRVVNYEQWLAYVNGDSHVFVSTVYNTYDEAVEQRDKLNKDEGVPS